MAVSLLEKTRRVTKLLQTTGSQSMKFSDMCNILGELLYANVYVISKKGKILGSHGKGEKNGGDILEHAEVGQYIFKNQNEELLYIKETKANLKPDSLHTFQPIQDTGKNSSITVIPISSEGERWGTLLIDREDGQFTEDDLVLAEYGATVVGMEILRSINLENEKEIRKKTVVQLALSSLSYSEMEAVRNILNELEGNEGLLIASKIADKAGITRSVIVNALRKLESAGTIESRSLGMKGTYIKILNDKLLEDLEITE